MNIPFDFFLCHLIRVESDLHVDLASGNFYALLLNPFLNQIDQGSSSSLDTACLLGEPVLFTVLESHTALVCDRHELHRLLNHNHGVVPDIGLVVDAQGVAASERLQCLQHWLVIWPVLGCHNHIRSVAIATHGHKHL